jgi:hypothetical protein
VRVILKVIYTPEFEKKNRSIDLAQTYEKAILKMAPVLFFLPTVKGQAPFCYHFVVYISKYINKLFFWSIRNPRWSPLQDKVLA